MKHTTSGKQTTSGLNCSANFVKENAGRRRMLRRDLSYSNQIQQPDLSIAKNMAEQLEMLEQYIAKVSVIDYQLRNNIRNAILNGTFAIDPASIAEKFLKFESELYS